MASRVRDAGKERQWRGHVAAWRASGQNIRTYCRQHGLSEASFYAWRQELARRDSGAAGLASSSRLASPPPRTPRRQSAPVAWLPLAVTEPVSLAVEVHLPGGVVLRVPPSVEAGTWERLLAALRSVAGTAREAAS